MGETITLANYAYKLDLDTMGFANGIKGAMSNFDGIKEKISGLTDMLGGSLKVGLIGAGIAVAGIAVEGVKSFASLQEEMSKFQAASGATDEEVSKVQDTAQRLFKTNTQSMEEIVNTATEMRVKMGANAEEIDSLEQKILTFSKTTGQSSKDVVDGVDDIGDAWGLTSDQSVAYLDILKKSNEEYGTDVASVTAALSKCAPAAKALGLTIDQTNGIMNLFAASGLDSSQAITALTYAAKTVKSPEEFKTMLADISAIKDPTERAQKAVELFGAKAGVAISNAFADGKTIDDFTLSMDQCTGVVDKAGEAYEHNLGAQLELAKKQFQGLTMDLGEVLMPAVTAILGALLKVLPVIEKIIGAAVQVIGTVIKPIGEGLKTMFSSFSTEGTKANSLLQSLVSAAQAAGNLIMTIVNGFISLFKAIWDKWGTNIISAAKKTWDDVMAVFSAVFDILTAVFQAFSDLFSGNWKAFGQDLLNIIKGVWDLIASVFKLAGQLLLDIGSAAFELIKTAVMAILTGMYDAMKALFTAIGEWFKGVWDGLVSTVSGFAEKFASAAKAVFTALWNGAKEIWSSISSWVSEAWDGIVSTVTGIGTKMYDAGAGIFNSLWDGLKSVWTNISSWVEEKVKWVADKFKNIKSDVASLFGETLVEVDMDSEGSSSSSASSVNYNHIPTWVASQLESLNGASSALASQQTDMQSIVPNVTAYIQEQIDALQQENDEISKQLSYEQKLEALAKAKDQHTQYVYREGEGFEWQSNLADVAKAQSDLAQADRESQLDAMKKYKENWENVLKAEQDDADEGKQVIADAVTTRILGAKWKEAVVSQQKDILDNFAKDYKNVCDQISANITALNEANAQAAQMAAWGDKITKDYNLTDKDWNTTAKFDDTIIQIPDMDSYLASSASNLSTTIAKNLSTGWKTMAIAGVPRTTSTTVNNTVKMGDVIVQNANDPEGFAKDLITQLPSIMKQEMYKK